MMSAIPDDIMQTAEKVLDEAIHADIDHESEIIARALLSERQRTSDLIEEVKAVLGPFAEKADRYNDIPGILQTHDNVELWQEEDNKGLRVDITVGDLRAARALLSKLEGKTP